MHRILIVEDDPKIQKVINVYLSLEGYELRLEGDGARALDAFEEWRPSLVLLDVVLPGADGWSILRAIRARSACPVIMLTALDETKDRLDGFKAGADDYIVKPFQDDELVARVQAVLRRMPLIVEEAASTFGNLKIDFAARQVRVNGQPVHLMPRDLALLLFLARHPNQTFERERLIEEVWGMDFEGSDRAVDLAVKRIRRAIADWSPAAGEIATVRGLGYQLRVSHQ